MKNVTPILLLATALLIPAISLTSVYGGGTCGPETGAVAEGYALSVWEEDAHGKTWIVDRAVQSLAPDDNHTAVAQISTPMTELHYNVSATGMESGATATSSSSEASASANATATAFTLEQAGVTVVYAEGVKARSSAVAGPGGGNTSSEGSAVIYLEILGSPVTVDFEQNFSIPILDHGELTVNESIVAKDSGFESRRVNSLHIVLDESDEGVTGHIIVSSAYAAAACNAAEAPVKPSVSQGRI